MSAYCPDAGDIIWLDFDPVLGNEQAGRRPAIVLSARAFNEMTGRCVACPITNTVRGWTFEVMVPAGMAIKGTIMADQVRALSWRARGAELAAAAPPELLDDVRARLAALIGVD
jgi:mRNA interferase MazF